MCLTRCVQAAAYPEALEVVNDVQGYGLRMTKLQAAVAYEQDNTNRTLLPIPIPILPS